MKQAKERLFAVIDVETTGSGEGGDRVTEVGIALYDGEKILRKFESLVNPERKIPPFVARLTGISNKMVARAPRFEEIANEILDITEGAIFVAHNVDYDYGVIKREMKLLDIPFHRRKICTVRLSRKAFPEFTSFSLGDLIKKFNIKVKARHRAMADTNATVQLLGHILDKDHDGFLIEDALNCGIRLADLPEEITLNNLLKIPERSGIYYLHDSEGDVLYIGQGKNVQKRVLKHFIRNERGVLTKLGKKTRDVSYEVMGNELTSKLFEVHEIDNLNPPFNTRRRRGRMGYCIYQYYNQSGYRCLATSEYRKGLDAVCLYQHELDANSVIRQMRKEFQLCERYCQTGRRFYKVLECKKPCKKACIKEEVPESYNLRVERAIDFLQRPFEEDFLIVDVGRSDSEFSVVAVFNGQVHGLGFVERNEVHSKEDFVNAVSPIKHLPTSEHLVKDYLRHSKTAKKLLIDN